MTNTEPDSRTRGCKTHSGFRPGKSCTSHLLNLTEHIEDGYEKRLITGAVFVDLSAAYDTVNHRRLLSKMSEMPGDVHLTDLIRTMLESRPFFVCSEWEEPLATTTKQTTTGKCTGTDQHKSFIRIRTVTPLNSSASTSRLRLWKDSLTDVPASVKMGLEVAESLPVGSGDDWLCWRAL